MLKNFLRIALFAVLFHVCAASAIEDLNQAQTDETITLEEAKEQHSSGSFIEKVFVEPKKITFENGFINEISAQFLFQGTNSFEYEDSDFDSTYPFTADIAAGAKFKDGKYRLYTQYGLTSGPKDMDNEFFSRFSSLFLEGKISKNHKLRIGTSRAPIGIEGQLSTFDLPFATRAQISRNFANAIATGVTLSGNLDMFDYDIGTYTSTRRMQGFKDGAEFIGRIGVKPFHNAKGRYFKELKVTAGTDIGHRGENYGVHFAALNYKYKKFLMDFEWAYANGSNSLNIDTSKRQGFFTTLGWNFTPQFQMLARYDQFDNNTQSSNDNNREYSIGLNYFFLKQRMTVMLNYVFSQNEKTNLNKNGVYFLTQFFI